MAGDPPDRADDGSESGVDRAQSADAGSVVASGVETLPVGGRGGSSRMSRVLARPVRVWTRLFASPADYGYVGVLVAFVAYTVVRTLGNGSLNIWDESIYGNVAKHMVTEGHWLIPHVSGFRVEHGYHLRPFLEKPPLVFWIQGLSMRVFGVGEFAVRFQTAAFTLLTAVLVYFVGRELVDRRVGVLSAAVFLTTPKVFASAKSGETEMALLFFGSTMTYLAWRGVREDDSRWFLYATVPAVCAVMTKGVDAGIWVLVLVPLFALHPWMLTSRNAVRAAGIVLPAISAWPLYAWYHYRSEFLEFVFFEQVVRRAQGELPYGQKETLFEFMRFPYLTEFPLAFDPWVYFFLPGTAFLLWFHRSRGSEEFEKVAFLAWWFACILAFYTRFGDNVAYTLKLYVPAALLVGWFLVAVADRTPYSIPVAVFGGVLSLAFSVRADVLSPYTYTRETTYYVTGDSAVLPEGSLQGWGFVLLVAVGVAALLLVAGLSRHRPDSLDLSGQVGLTERRVRYGKVALLAVCVLGLSGALVGQSGAEDWESEQESLASVIDAEVSDETAVYVTHSAKRGHPHYAPLGFYTDARLNDLDVERLPEGALDSYSGYLLAPADELGRYGTEYEVVHRYTTDGVEMVLVRMDRG